MSTALVESNGAPKQTALADLRAASLSVPVEVMQRALAEYKERREEFRAWLKEQLVEGIHYGFAPGCEPRLNASGEVLIYQKDRTFKAYPKTQWQAKPSLYKAGADFICDLLGVQPKFEADMDAWQQLGAQAGTFVMRCSLISKSTNEVIGEGRGVRKEGQKGGDANNAIKMAQKAAKVDAVLNAYGLSDLFTQDRDPDDVGPKQSPNAETVSKAKGAIEKARDEARLAQLWTEIAKRESLTDEERGVLHEAMEQRRQEIRGGNR